MAKIDRYDGNLKAFASEATGEERTIFGDDAQSNALDDNINAAYLAGWETVSPSAKPPKEWFNAAQFTATQLTAYLHQVGVAEYHAEQEYHIGSITNSSGILYSSLTNNNIGNTPASSSSDWKRIADLNTFRDNPVITGTANAIVATLTPPTTALVDGMIIAFKPAANPTVRNPTFQLDGHATAGNIVKAGQSTIELGDLSLNVGAFLQYFESSNYWILLNPINASRTAVGSPTVQTYNESTTPTYTFAHGLGVVPKFVQPYIICLIADLGYTVGQRLLIDKSVMVASSNDHGLTCDVTSTNVVLTIAADGLAIADLSNSRQVGVLTNDSWSIGVDCFA